MAYVAIMLLITVCLPVLLIALAAIAFGED